MGDGTKENPYTRKDVIKKIEENGGTAEGLDLSGKVFETGIDLRKLDLSGIILREAYFKSIHPGVAYLFNGVHLEGAILMHTHLEGANAMNAHLEGADLTEAHFDGAYLTSAHLEGAYLWDTHLEGANLVEAYLEGAYLHGAKVSPDTRLEGIDWGNYILGEEKESSFYLAALTYRQPKIWYTNAGLYDIAGRFFFREMTARRKAMRWWPNPLNRIFSKLVSILCGYGERPERVVVSALVIIFGMAIVYIFGGLNPAYGIYFSAVSFTALGYGSWVNTTSDAIRGLGAAESFLGVFMMALFLVTFTRKMTR